MPARWHGRDGQLDAGRRAGRFFELIARHSPATTGPRPTRWGEPDHVAALDRDLLALLTAENTGPGRYDFGYLLVLAQPAATRLLSSADGASASSDHSRDA